MYFIKYQTTYIWFDLINTERTHYFESRPSSSSHDPEAETQAIRNLVEKGQIICH